MLKSQVEALHQKRRFTEAQAAKRKLTALAAELETRRLQRLKDEQWNEVLTAEESHQAEFEELRDYWDRQLLEWEEKDDAMLGEMEKKHEEQMRELQTFLEQSIPEEPRLNSDLLNLMRIEENLIKTHEYEEAKKVSKRMIAIRNEEREKWEVHRRRKIEAECSAMYKRQQIELQALETRLQSEYHDIIHNRTQTIERFLLKCQNVKKEQNLHHKMDLMRMTSTRRSERNSTS